MQDPKALPKLLSKQMAENIPAAKAFHDHLPAIVAMTRRPILVERDRRLIQVVGYDAETGVYAAGTQVPAVGLTEAKDRLDVAL